MAQESGGGAEMKQAVGVFDPEKEYGRSLADLLIRRQKDWKIYFFASREELVRHSTSGRLSLLLTCKPPDEELAGTAESVLCLTEEPGETLQDDRILYLHRYQPVDQLLHKAAAAMQSRQKKKGVRNLSACRLYSVFSPEGGRGKTCFSLLLGRFLAREAPVLYLNLEEISGLNLLLGKAMEKGNLSDALFFFSQGRLKDELPKLTESWRGMEVLHSVKYPEDVSQTSQDILADLLLSIADMGRYHAIVAECGGSIAGSERIWQISSRIFIPMTDRVYTGGKLQNVKEWLLLREGKDTVRNMKDILIPRTDPTRIDEMYLEELYLGSYGGCVRGALEELR